LPRDDEAWVGPAIGLLDLDAFFASVEFLDHPEWRGKPLIVGGPAAKRGVVSTASYEARAYGVHSAMPSAEAARLCPQAIWVTGNLNRYKEVSDQVMARIAQETPYVEQVSIDEAFFDITPSRFSKESPVAVARRIQAAVAELGVTCSIGLGPTRTIAKMASELEKPRGLSWVLPPDGEAFLAPRPPRAISGVGAATARILDEKGLTTIGKVAACDPAYLERILGVAGPRLWNRARAGAETPIRAWIEGREVKSVSAERTFEKDLSSRADVEAALAFVAGIAASRLRKKGFFARQVSIKVKTGYDQAKTAQVQLARSTQEDAPIKEAALSLLSKCWHEGQGVRLVGVGLAHLGTSPTSAGGEQLTLLDEAGALSAEPSTIEEAPLGSTADKIRARFGDEALLYGRDLRFLHHTAGGTTRHRAD
jgi:DNA polymerase-4